MQAGDTQLGKVLSSSQLMVIPLFQRPYVWRQQENWVPLWEDIQRAAEGVEAEQQRGKVEEGVTYFLGAVVTQERQKAPRRLSSTHIIDGQQRMTTLQILLAAARSVAAASGHDTVSAQYEALVVNDHRAVHPSFPEDALKLLPLPQDRDAYRWAVRLSGEEMPPEHPHQLVAARDWFENQIKEWAQAGRDLQARLEYLHFAITERVQIVHIMLGPNDDPQVIFEALNYRGAQLLPADLIKNLLFQNVEAQGDQNRADELLMKHWLPFDALPWRGDATTGRVKRTLIDVFLMHWLTATTGKEVNVEHLFADFKDWLKREQANAAATIIDLRESADVFAYMRDLAPDSPLGALIDSMTATQTNTPWPILLYLETESAIPEDQVQIAASALDSYLMRRSVCGMTTKDYNRLFLRILQEVKASDPISAGVTLRDTLAKETADARLWPSDSQFRAGLLDGRLYTKVVRARLRTLLVGLENHLRSGWDEPRPPVRAAESKLTVEHLLPQKWQAHWPTLNGTDNEEDLRFDSIHRLGNLTLLSHKLNPKVSNGAWSAKADEIRRHSLLKLTTASVFASPPPARANWTDAAWASWWDEERIRLRGLWLANEAVSAWPRPPGGADVDWEDSLRPNASISGRRMSLSVSVRDLLDARLLDVGEVLEWIRPQRGEAYYCQITGEGSLKLQNGQVERSPSGASTRAAGGGSFDGWETWRAPLRNNVTLGELRDQYEELEPEE